MPVMATMLDASDSLTQIDSNVWNKFVAMTQSVVVLFLGIRWCYLFDYYTWFFWLSWLTNMHICICFHTILLSHTNPCAPSCCQSRPSCAWALNRHDKESFWYLQDKLQLYWLWDNILNNLQKELSQEIAIYTWLLFQCWPYSHLTRFP